MSVPPGLPGDGGAGATAAGPLALVGSGEYLPGMEALDRLLLTGRPPVFVQLPIAAAPEGPATLAYWTALGQDHAQRVGATPVVLAARSRGDAEDAAVAGQVAGAGLIYLSGGDPVFLAETLRGTALARAVLGAWQAGAALAGCSAGAMALAADVPDIRRPHRPALPGLGLLPGVLVLPHFDRFLGRVPDLATRLFTAAGPLSHSTVIGIDEQTAAVHLDGGWTVHGRGQVWCVGPGGRTGYPPGGVPPLPTPVVPAAVAG